MMRPHRATILVIWIAIIAVAMTTEVEDADSITSQESATAASAKLYNGLPKDALPKMAIQGIRNLDLWKMANDDAVTTNNKLMKRLSTPWKTKMSARATMIDLSFRNHMLSECHAFPPVTKT